MLALASVVFIFRSVPCACVLCYQHCPATCVRVLRYRTVIEYTCKVFFLVFWPLPCADTCARKARYALLHWGLYYRWTMGPLDPPPPSDVGRLWLIDVKSLSRSFHAPVENGNLMSACVGCCLLTMPALSPQRCLYYSTINCTAIYAHLTDG